MALFYPDNARHNNPNLPFTLASDNGTQGWYHVATTTDRDNLPTAKRLYGAMVVVGSTAYIYNDTDLANWTSASSWTEVGTGAPGGGGIELTDLSVDTVNPASTTVSSLTYDNTTGEFNFTPIDVTGKQDTLTSTSDVPGLDTALGNKQDNLTSTSDVPGLDTALGNKADKETLTQSGGTITGDINTTTGTFTLTAPTSGGGDALTTSGLDQFDSVTFTALSDVDIMIYDNATSDWINASPDAHKAVWFGVSGTTGDVVQWDGSAWNADPLPLENLSNVDITGLGSGDILKYDGTQWEPFELSYTTLAGTPTLANIALTGEYDDINNRPIFTGTGTVTITESSAAGQTTYTINGTGGTGTGTVDSVNGIAPVAGDVTLAITDLSDTLGNYASGSGIKWDGSQWSQAFFLDGTSSIHDLLDVEAFQNFSSVSGQMMYNTSTTSTPNWRTMIPSQSPSGGDVLTWDSAGNPKWESPSTVAGGLPTGGTAGQFLVKDSTTDYDADWQTLTFGPNLLVEGDGTDEGSITLNCSQNTHGIEIQSAPHSDSATYSIVLPATAGTTGQILSKTATDQWEWINATSGAVDSVNTQTGPVVLYGDDIDTTSSSSVTVTDAINAAVSAALTAGTSAGNAQTAADAAQVDATQALSDAASAASTANTALQPGDDVLITDITNSLGTTLFTNPAVNSGGNTVAVTVNGSGAFDYTELDWTDVQLPSGASAADNDKVLVWNNTKSGTGGWDLATQDTGTGVPSDSGSTNGDVLTTDGSGTYTWETPTGSGVQTPVNLTYTASSGALSSSTENNGGVTIPEVTTSDPGLMSSADKTRFDGIPAATAGTADQVLTTDGSAYSWEDAGAATVTEDSVRSTNTINAAGFYTLGGLPNVENYTSMFVMDNDAGSIFWLSENPTGVYTMNRAFLNSVSGLSTAEQANLDRTKKFMDAYKMATIVVDTTSGEIDITFDTPNDAFINMAALPTQSIRVNYTNGGSANQTSQFSLNDFKSYSGAVVTYGASSGTLDTAIQSIPTGTTRIDFESSIEIIEGVVQYDNDGFTANVVKPTDIISVAMEAPTAKAYSVVLKMPHSGEVTEINTKLGAGTCDVQVSFGGTDLLAAVQSTSSTLATGTTFSEASFEAGDEVIVTVSNLGGSSDEDLTISMSYNIVY